MKISPKSILEEGQTSRECHVKQAVPDSKGRACHATKSGEADRKVARAARATRHGHATWAEVARPDRAMWHGRATCAVLQPDFKYRDFSCFWGIVSFSYVFFLVSFFFFSIPL